jgi:two-component system sensor histidine kinase QseC
MPEWCRPTLVRRLMVAQILLLSLLWSLFVAVALIDVAENPGTFNQLAVYDAVISVAENLAGASGPQRQSLEAIDHAVRADFESGLIPELAPHLQVWQNGQLLYRTRSDLPLVLGSGKEGIESVSIQGKRWRLRTHISARSNTRVVMLAPNEPWSFFLTVNSHGYYLLPLVISLPFLLLPAWLSIRIALRPWRRLAQEVATRGPHDLTPLDFKPSHLELAAMVESVNSLLLRVNESTQRERNFIADAAHELRTPLAAMRVNVEALQARTTEAGQLELLTGILNSGDRAARLVGQLLLLMHSDSADSGAHYPIALDALLQERLAVLSGLGAKCGVELELSAPTEAHVLGHRETLISLIDNIVDNAIKFSPPHGVVTVALEVEGGLALLTVSDQGPGIEPALRQRVFDRFFRNPQQTQSGSGLGLSIANAVARQHGGKIALESGMTGGLVVCVSIPVVGVCPPPA